MIHQQRRAEGPKQHPYLPLPLPLQVLVGLLDQKAQEAE